MARKLKDKVGALPDSWKPKKLPAKLGSCIDLLYQTRAARLAAQHEVDEQQAQETSIKEHIKGKFKWEDLEGARGTIAQCSINPSDEPVLEDPLKFFKWVAKTGSFDLLCKQVAKDAARLRWEKGINIPGVVKFVNRKFSITKISKPKK